MPLFRRDDRDKCHPILLPPDVLERLSKHGEELYFGREDVYDIDMWPGDYLSALLALNADEQIRWVDRLAAIVAPVGGWAAYAAEALLLLQIKPDEKDTTGVGQIIESSLQFQRTSGVWWAQMSPAEQLWWQRHHPDEGWIDPRPAPTPDAVTLTPLEQGEERQLTLTSRGARGKAMYVVRLGEERYEVQLDYESDDGTQRVRDTRGEASGLFAMYVDFGRRVPFPGIWVDPELEPFLTYPMPRL
jgi:hypothetical protein